MQGVFHLYAPASPSHGYCAPYCHIVTGIIIIIIIVIIIIIIVAASY